MATFNTAEAPDRLWVLLESDEIAVSHDARETLILHYQFLVKAMARKLKATLPSYILDEDLISYGQIGLIRAIDKYDCAVGPFKRFASTIVHGAIIDELRSQDWAPRGLRRDQRTIGRAESHLRVAREGEPTMAQVASHMGWETLRLESTLRRINNSQHRSLEGVETHHAEGTTMMTPDGLDQTGALCAIFVQTFEGLSIDGQIVLAHRYFLNETLAVVAEEVHLPLAVVRRLHTDAVNRVLGAMESAVS